MLGDCITNSLYACGTAGLPKTLFIADRQWKIVRTFKHDFFAATGLYERLDEPSDSLANTERVVLKISRLQSFFGIPLAWIGRSLKNREVRLLRRIQILSQIPQLLGEYGRNGFVYRFIDGQSLDEKPELPDTFFDDLKLLLHRIHNLGICYMDFNKRGNILLGKDKRPYIIDFQISLMLDWPGCKRLCRMLQREDYYHLLKHKRRLRPDLLSESERELSKHRSLPIRIHRFLTVPLRTLRRRLLSLLYRNKLLAHDDSFEPTPENDPARFDA
jgi:hypothetical protein